MIRIAYFHKADVVRDGITYYQFDFSFLPLNEYLDLLTGGFGGKIIDILEAVIPSPSIMAYLPKMIPSGTDIDGWIAPANLYLLWGSIYAYEPEGSLANLLIAHCLAEYTIYPPTEPGVTFLPDFTPPTEVTHWEEPLDATHRLYLPKTGWHDTLTINLAYFHKNDNYTHFNAKLLWPWSGADPSDSHFLAHLDEFIYLTQGPFEYRMFYLGYPPNYGIAEILLDNDATWDLPEWTNTDYTSQRDIIDAEVSVLALNEPRYLLYPYSAPAQPIMGVGNTLVGAGIILDSIIDLSQIFSSEWQVPLRLVAKVVPTVILGDSFTGILGGASPNSILGGHQI